MTTQFQLDFDRKLPVSAQIGMETADENASQIWKRWIDGVIQSVARKQEEFTVDEIYTELEALPNPPSTHNLSAIGPRMKKVAAELGYMTATEKVLRSKRPGKNGNLSRVWRSNLFRRP